jgi:AraC-like DNA-binding protein
MYWARGAAVLKERDRYADQVPDTAVRTLGRGVLHPDLAATRFALARTQPRAALAPFVDFHWILRWDLRGQPAHEQTILPHPNVNLAFEAHGAGIYGVDRRLFTRVLSGRGMVFGVRFRAGCFRPFWQAPISQLTDRVVPAARLFGAGAERTRQAIMLAGGPGAGAGNPGRSAIGASNGAAGSSDAGLGEAGADAGSDGALAGADAGSDGALAGADAGWAEAEMTAYAEALLCAVLPEPDPLAEQAAGLVARITADPALRRVDELSSESGMTVRSLQRLFSDHVGVSPKWVMRRARLHEAAERADSGELIDWAELAAELGYADQAHLTRDFTDTIGVPPTRYAPAAEGSAGVS